MMRRSRAREAVLQLLYQEDLNPMGTPPDRIETFLRGKLDGNEELLVFARELLDGIKERRAELDRRLAVIAENWRLERMAATDRNVLRLGAYEILYGDSPGPVIINEAIELAKRYGGPQSAQFVNGILDKLLPGHTPKGPDPEAVED